MTATPTSFAATPDRKLDVLSEALRTMRLNGSVFLDGRFSAPFGVLSPRQFDASTPLAHLRHVSVFHLIAEGGCTLEMADGARREVSNGDILLIPFADDHRFRSGEVSDIPNADSLVRPGPIDGMWRIDYGGGGPVTRMVCGFIESPEFMFAPVLRSLPSLLVYRTGDEKLGSVITSTVRSILELADTATPGSELALGRLMELLFIEVVRQYATRLPSDARGWFAALNDPILVRAMRAVHNHPARRWTVEDIAAAAATSRTVLGERFTAVMGQSPMEYVTSWRMQIAAARLRESTDSLAAIAAYVGYESEAAFNRAFKRVTGISPGRWREGAEDAPVPE